MIRLPIQKLAASPTPPLQSKFKSDLLHYGVTWQQDVNYLRDIYREIYMTWESEQPFTYEEDEEGNRTVSEIKYSPEQDKRLYQEIEPLLRELLLAMQDISRQRTSRNDILKATDNSLHDFNTASSYAHAEDWSMGLVYFSYALAKIRQLLDSMTREVNNQSLKVGYGYDSSGEVHEQGGTSGDDRHLWDTANGSKKDRTPQNPANLMVDPEAESDYKSLAEFKHHHVIWPPRTR